MSSEPPPSPPPPPPSTQHDPTPEDFQRWDRAMAEKRTDWSQLEREMRQYVDSNNPALHWRLALVNHFLGLDKESDEEIKQSAVETFRCAEKALKMVREKGDLNSVDAFQAHKWHAIATGKMALLETDPSEKLRYTAHFLNSLEECAKKNPQDQMVLFMQGRFQLALALITEEELRVLRQHVSNMPELDLEDAEKKIRKSIELAPDLLDNYITLAYILVKMPRPDALELARSVVERGLQVESLTKSDELLKKELAKMKRTLGS